MNVEQAQTVIDSLTSDFDENSLEYFKDTVLTLIKQKEDSAAMGGDGNATQKKGEVDKDQGDEKEVEEFEEGMEEF